MDSKFYEPPARGGSLTTRCASFAPQAHQVAIPVPYICLKVHGYDLWLVYAI